jgi:Tol biopolymer transport system component
VEVFKMNSDGTGQANLTNTIGGVHDFRPDFSPNGDQIAYTLLGSPPTSDPEGDNPDGDSEIYVMNTDGSGQTNLTDNSVTDCQFALACIYELRPDFSPDGTEIVYDRGTKLVGNSFDDTRDIYKMNSDGSGQTPLIVTLGIDERSPDFSPKGDKIVYMVEGGGDPSNPGGDREIYTVNANGTVPNPNLTEDARTLNSARAADELPDWGVQRRKGR